jgi:hypothetical protein
MDEVKRTYRTVKTDLRKTVRGVDGKDPKDCVGNAGDEIGQELETWATTSAKLVVSPRGPRGGPATTTEPTM